MQFKKVISSLLVVILLLSLTVFSASASADSAFTLAVEASSTAGAENAFIKAGETIEVKVAIPEGKNPGVAYMMFDVVYDADAFDLDEKSIVVSDIFVMGSPDLDRAGVIIDEDNGVVTFITDMLSFENNTATGEVVALKFTVKSGVCANAKIDVANFLAYNTSHASVATQAGSATIALHDFSEGKKVAPTCTEDGLITYKCNKCDVSYDEVDGVKALGHDFSKLTCTEDSTCSRCGLLDKKATGHNYSSWKVETEAEEGVEGVKARSCSNCGDKQTDKIPALPVEEAGFPVALVIVIAVVVLAGAGFCVYWFVLRKK
jgi:hypothetical protein